MVYDINTYNTYMKAPDFNLPDQNGNYHNLNDYSGSWLLIYFYPKDDTPGCTKEACNFRDTNEDYLKKGIQILGISKDNQKSHKKFVDKYSLNFPLLTDADGKVAKEFGALGERSMFGKTFTGILRNSYLINPEGDIVKTYTGVNPQTHSKEILEDFDKFQKNI